MKNKIIYTSVFGNYDSVKESKISGWDFTLFSDKNALPLYKDNSRNAKKFKIFVVTVSDRFKKDNEKVLLVALIPFCKRCS